MKRAFLAIFCGAALLANSIACADAVSDREMADRYSQAAQSGDSEAQFYMGALYSSGVGRPRSDQRHSGGSRAPLTRVIRMPCWFLPDSMPLGGELRTTT
jgi:hypothetical protein